MVILNEGSTTFDNPIFYTLHHHSSNNHHLSNTAVLPRPHQYFSGIRLQSISQSSFRLCSCFIWIFSYMCYILSFKNECSIISNKINNFCPKVRDIFGVKVCEKRETSQALLFLQWFWLGRHGQSLHLSPFSFTFSLLLKDRVRAKERV